MDPVVTALVLLAAIFHATWNAVIKTGDDQLVSLSAVMGFGSLFCIVLLPFVPFPSPESWPYLLAAAFVLHTGYFFFMTQAYRFGDLSYVYPVARGLPPLVVAGLAAWLVGEVLPAEALAGVTLASLGIASLALERGLPWHYDSRGLIYALTTSAFIAAYTLVDGIGVRLSGSSLGFFFWLMALHGFPITALALVLRRRIYVAHVRRYWKRSLAGTAIVLIGYSIVLWAMTQGAIAAVSAMRETSVIFAALIGTLVLGEPFGRWRVLAASLVAAGVILINLSHHP